MKIKVINSFRDKNTKEIHQVGEVLEVSNERGAEIISAGNYAVKIDEPKQAETPEPKKEKKSKAKTNK